MRLEVKTTAGGWVAAIVPISGTVRAFAQQLEEEGLEVVVGAIELVDQQDRGAWPGVLERTQQRAADEVLGREEPFLADLLAARLGQADAQELARIVPLVQRLGRVDALVALQADQRGVQGGGQGLGRLGLAHPGLALQQQRLGQAQAEEHRRGQALVGEVARALQARGHRLDVGDQLGEVALRRVPVPRRFGRHPPACATTAS